MEHTPTPEGTTMQMTPEQKRRMKAEAKRLKELAAAMARADDWSLVAEAAREGEALTCRTRRLARKEMGR
jgi:hypothetical protein